MSKRFMTISLGVLVAILALSAGYLLRIALSDRSLANGGLATSVEFGAPFELIDHTSAPITEAAFKGNVSLLFFGFTHCPDVCPTTLYEIGLWLEALGPAADTVEAYFVTVDPERDTAAFLAEYIIPQNPDVIGITGEPEKVWQMARSWRIFWQKIPLGDGEYTMDHFASVYVLDRSGQLYDKISYGETVENAAAKIRKALDAPVG